MKRERQEKGGGADDDKEPLPCLHLIHFNFFGQMIGKRPYENEYIQIFKPGENELDSL